MAAGDFGKAVAREIKAGRPRGGIQRLVSALNMGSNATVAVLGCSVSTGTGTWAVGALKRMVGARPRLGLKTYLWVDATLSPWSDTASGAYDAGTTLYTGVAAPVYGRKLIDTFNRAAGELLGSTSTPVQAAKRWVSGGAGSGAWATDGTGGLVAVAASPLTQVRLDAGVVGTRMRAQCTVTMDQTTATKQVAVTLGGASYRVVYYVRNVAGVWSAMLWKNGATSAQVVGYTTITSAAGKSSVNMVAILDGTTASLTVDGQTVTGSILATDVTAIGGATMLGILSTDNVSAGTGTRITNLSMDLIEDGPTGSITIYNASRNGTTLTYSKDRISRMLPVEPDVILVDSCSHNHLTDTPAAFEATVQAAISAARDLWPHADIVISSENPELPPVATRAFHDARNLVTADMARRNGWGYVSGCEAFMADGPQPNRIRSDGVHPTSPGSDDAVPDPANGVYLWVSEMVRFLVAEGVTPVTGDGI